MLELPVIPTAVLAVVNLLAPFAIAVVNAPRWTAGSKRWMSVAASVLLSLVALAIFYASGEPLPNWPQLLLLGVLVSQSSYTLLFKKPATEIEAAVGVK